MKFSEISVVQAQSMRRVESSNQMNILITRMAALSCWAIARSGRFGEGSRRTLALGDAQSAFSTTIIRSLHRQ